MNEIEKFITDFIVQSIGCESEQVVNARNLFEIGFDSFSFMELIARVEGKFQIHFSDEDLISPKFKNITGIKELIISLREKNPRLQAKTLACLRYGKLP